MTDMWTFGIVLYEIVARQAPYDGENIMEVALQIRDKGLHPTIPIGCPPLFKEIMERCWNLDPNLRPVSINQIQNNIDNICFLKFGFLIWKSPSLHLFLLDFDGLFADSK